MNPEKPLKSIFKLAIKKLHFCLTLSFIITALSVKGQDGEKYFETYADFKTNDTPYTFLEKNYLKAEPNNDSKTIAVIEIGEKLILNATYNNENNGVRPSYYQVKYQDKIGYIKAESLSLTKLKANKKETYFLFKLKTNKDSSTSSIIIREVKANKMITDFNTILQGDMFLLKLSNNKGLDSVDQLIVIDYISEACGAEGGETFFTWNSEGIKLLAHLSSIGDAGVFSLDERLIFPSDTDGIKGALIFKSEMYEMLDEETNWIKSTTEERKYLWVKGKIVPEFRAKPKEDY